MNGTQSVQKLTVNILMAYSIDRNESKILYKHV